MNRLIYISAALIFLYPALLSAQDISPVLQKLEKQISNRSLSCSSILQDTAYMYLHSKPEFRNLIKKRALRDGFIISKNSGTEAHRVYNYRIKINNKNRT
jgi:hypothetical protein